MHVLALILPVTSGMPEKLTELTKCDQGEVLTSMLPAPFDVLQVIFDKLRNRRRSSVACWMYRMASEFPPDRIQGKL